MKLQHKFVKSVPDNMENGVVYVSVDFSTAIHKCCCGCGKEVVTPLSPVGWKLIFNGETISLYPSIGNWSFDCQSHYWITENTVEWASKWDKKKIEAGRKREAMDKKAHYKEKNRPSVFGSLFKKK